MVENLFFLLQCDIRDCVCKGCVPFASKNPVHQRDCSLAGRGIQLGSSQERASLRMIMKEERRG